MTSVGPRRNFAILYSSREGSSAIIGKLQKHPEIHVPCFEGLDVRNLEKWVDDPPGEIGTILDQACRSGSVPGHAGTYRGESVIGFKWRPFGNDPAVQALRSNRCLAIFLYRRDTVRRALSMLYKPQHMQFKLAKMPKAERQETIRRMQSATFTIDPAELTEKIIKYTNSKKAIWNKYTKNQADYMLLEYELFETAPIQALNLSLSKLELESFQHEPESQFVKTMRNDIETQCENLDEVMKDRAVRSAIARYEAFLENIGAVV